jgi:S-adenosylmethionine:tRNA ribosyltransferase-isomerase
MASAGASLTFALSSELEATEPPEARGLSRDGVRLLVSDLERDVIEHTRFSDLPRWLDPGDLLVVNTSGTMNAAVPAAAPDGEEFELHVSTRLPGGFWTVELRIPGEVASLPCRQGHAGTTLRLRGGGQATLLAPYPLEGSLDATSRLWMAALLVPDGVPAYLARCGFPIRYSYVKQPWPSSMYQTVFANEMGSAEMPSAGRPFTPELVTRLVSAGIQIAPVVLHTGVASLEDHEPPYEEFYRVSAETAERVNDARRNRHRIIAVGTTVVRALETVTDERGRTSAGEGWTSLVINDERRLRAVNGLITGLHEPHATHLTMLGRVVEAAGGDPRHLERAYAEALARGYLWHEFGDSHLILTARPKDVPHVRRTCPTSEGRAPRPKDCPTSEGRAPRPKDCPTSEGLPHVRKDVPYRAW